MHNAMKLSADADAKSVWLHSWSDPVAGLKTHSSCVQLVDLNSDGESKLLVADLTKKLKIYKSTSMASEHALLDIPVAMTVFYPDANVPRTPAIAIAAGPFVFIYRNLRPYYKFTLPATEIDPVESDIWARANKDILTPQAVADALTEARDRGTRLSAKSLDFMALQDEPTRRTFIEEHKSLPHVQQTVVTCMTRIKKEFTEDDGISSLVLGTESGRLFILESNGASIAMSVALPSAPVHLSVSGALDVEWRIVVACRDNKLYSVKNGDSKGSAVLIGGSIETDHPVVTLARWDRTIYIADMANRFQSMTLRGRKNFSITMSCPIRDLEVMVLRRGRVPHVVLVGLADGQVLMYNEKWLVATLQMDGPVHVLRSGPYGREENALIIIHGNGCVSVKMLRRTAPIDITSSSSHLPPEQDIPLSMPKKTKLYLEHAQRERELATNIHQNFQKDLCRLRLATARAYVKTLTSGDLGVSNVGGTTLRIHVAVQGLGPLFRLIVMLQNASQMTLTNLSLVTAFNPKFYRLPRASVPIPVLLPGVANHIAVDAKSIDPLGRADVIRILVANPNSALPMVSAAVAMPRCDIIEA